MNLFGWNQRPWNGASAAGGAAPTPTIATGFYEAFTAWFQGDPICQASAPGGIVNAEAAPNQVFPYARVWDLENQEPVTLEDEEVELTLSTYAADDGAGGCGDEKASAAGKAILTRILDPTARGEWLFTHNGATWMESGCLWIPPGKLGPAGKSKNGNRVWRYDMFFKFFMVKPD